MTASSTRDVQVVHHPDFQSGLGNGSRLKVAPHVSGVVAPGNGQVQTRMYAAGICCPAEVALINKVLEPLPGWS